MNSDDPGRGGERKEISDHARMAAELLKQARQTGRALEDGLPEQLRPATLDEGYEVQAALLRAWGAVPRGYKIGCTSELAQRALGVAEPFAGRALERGLLESPAVFAPADYIFHFLEPEFAFRLRAALPPRSEPYGRDEVAAAVDLAYPAIEVVTSSYGAAWSEVGAVQLVADNAAHALLVLGPGSAAWRELDLAAQRVELRIDGDIATEGQGANALGHPLEALTWLANDRARRGGGLLAGEVVSTGVVTGLRDLQPGQRALADFGPLGSVELQAVA
ncbi:MAG: hydratase [Kiloniellales bacterium]|nr:hydratase [Kiloniellales bacterium]